MRASFDSALILRAEETPLVEGIHHPIVVEVKKPTEILELTDQLDPVDFGLIELMRHLTQDSKAL